MRSLQTLGVVLGSLTLLTSTALAGDKAPDMPTSLSMTGAVASTQGTDTITVITPPAPGPAEETYQTMNGELFVSGVVLFGAGYAAGAIAASQSDREGMDRLYVPLVGPWLALSDRGACPVQDADCDGETTAKVLIIGDGIVQAAGAFLMLDAVLFPKTVRRTIPATALRVKPIRVGSTGEGRGLAYTGQF